MVCPPMGTSPASPLEILDIALEYVTNPSLHCSLILCTLWLWLSCAFTSLIMVPNVNYTSTHTLWTRKILLFMWVYVQLICTFAHWPKKNSVLIYEETGWKEHFQIYTFLWLKPPSYSITESFSMIHTSVKPRNLNTSSHLIIWQAATQ